MKVVFWNDMKQAQIRCDIYNDRYDRNENEPKAKYYIRYVSLAASLQPALSEYDLLGALKPQWG
jgi:hypothetical protein